jgi:hypothetical protein
MLSAVTASGYVRGEGGRANPLPNRSPPAFLLLLSPLLPLFPSIYLSPIFSLAVILSLDKKLNREDPNKYRGID